MGVLPAYGLLRAPCPGTFLNRYRRILKKLYGVVNVSLARGSAASDKETRDRLATGPICLLLRNGTFYFALGRWF